MSRYLNHNIIIPAMVLVGLVSLGLWIAVLPLINGSTYHPPSVTSMQVSAASTYQPFNEMVKSADAVFVGTVVSIGKTRWNQDSGVYWESDSTMALPYYDIEINVQHAMIGTSKVGNRATLTVIGASPNGTDPSSGAPVTGDNDHALLSGTTAIFFAKMRPFAWRQSDGSIGTRPSLMLNNAQPYSTFVQQGDGRFVSKDPQEKEQRQTLEQWIERIRQARQ